MSHPPLQYLDNDYDVPITLMAGADVSVDARAITQAQRLARLRPVLRARGSDILRVVLTPDLHRGAHVPVGVAFDTVGALVPGAIGNDVGCGMRLAVLNVNAEALDEAAFARVSARLRKLFFEGGRDLPLLPADRLAILEYGLLGLLQSPRVREGAGLWHVLADDLDAHLEHSRELGFGNGGVDARMRAWADASGERDSQLGSLGGGNHFCELQQVTEIVDGPTAWAWGLRANALALMTHTGSLGFGALAGGVGIAAARAERAPRSQLPQALLPVSAEAAAGYLLAMANAANLALANRLALTLMAFSALQDELGADLKCSSVGDAAHNLIWPLEGGRFRHRKGACPAESGAGAGEPAFIPGSMGDSSWVLAGAGNEEMLSSAAHGAGRLLSRSKAARVRESTHDPRLRVVTPVDPLVLTRSGRRDLIHEQERRLREEAPYAYKPVEGVVAAVVAAGAARRVCRLRPLLTVKG